MKMSQNYTFGINVNMSHNLTFLNVYCKIMHMNTIAYLKEVYGYDNPIILKNIRIGGLSKTALRQQLSRAYKKGEISKSGTGVFCFPNPDRLLPFNGLDARKIIEAKYIKKGFVIDGLDINRIGYYSGFGFLNMIGISPQVPNFYEIVTNNATSNKRETFIGGVKVIIRKPKVEINYMNWKTLQFLDMIKLISYEDLESERKIDILKKYINKYLTKVELTKNLNFYGIEVTKKLVESKLIYEFK